MKKLLTLIILLLFLATGKSYAVDADPTESVAYDRPNHIRIVTISWSDASGNGVNFQLTQPWYNGWIIEVDTDPGTTAPTDNYDIELLNDLGVDLLAGELYDRDTSTSERKYLSNPAYNKKLPTLNIPNSSQDANSGGNIVNIIRLYIYTEEEVQQ